MGIRFRKSIKLGNLVKLNISKSGVSATVGKGGASINVGKRGVYANVNPSIAGIKGTGVSYRKKLIGNPLKNNQTIKNINKIKKDNKEQLDSNFDDIVNIHKNADNVLNVESFSKLEGIDDLDLLINGDEEKVEKEIGIFMDNLSLPYPVTCDYELEDNELYVDLDLPEIEIFKKKGIDLTKEEYAKTIFNLGLYLTCNFFNISSYIEKIILSAFISKRNGDGDLVDEYIYSIKFIRETFEKTNIQEIDNVYDFLLKFENRVILNSNYSFKAIKPFTLSNNALIDETIFGLKNLGFKTNDIESIIPKLKELDLKSTNDYIKEALKLLNE